MFPWFPHIFRMLIPLPSWTINEPQIVKCFQCQDDNMIIKTNFHDAKVAEQEIVQLKRTRVISKKYCFGSQTRHPFQIVVQTIASTNKSVNALDKLIQQQNLYRLVSLSAIKLDKISNVEHERQAQGFLCWTFLEGGYVKSIQILKPQQQWKAKKVQWNMAQGRKICVISDHCLLA